MKALLILALASAAQAAEPEVRGMDTPAREKAFRQEPVNLIQYEDATSNSVRGPGSRVPRYEEAQAGTPEVPDTPRARGKRPTRHIGD